MTAPAPTAGAKVLILEDEYLIATMMQEELQEAGFQIAGPVATVAHARMLIDSTQIHAAVLDVQLIGELSFELADDLIASGIPVIFCTGFDSGVIPPRFQQCSHLIKPLQSGELAQTLVVALASIERRTRKGPGMNTPGP